MPKREGKKMETKFRTVCSKTVRGRTYKYLLRHDDKGYFWDGLVAKTWRRKNLSYAVKHAEQAQFDVYEEEY